MVESYVGQSVFRPEDPELLRGERPFVADLSNEFLRDEFGESTIAEVVFVRSPFAHARIGAVFVAEAKRAPGVLAVVSSADHDVVPAGSVIPEFYDARYAMPILAEGTVRYVGEPVVAVVAETVAQAVDASELVEVEWEPLEAVIDVNDALADTTVLFDATNRARSRGVDGGGQPTNLVLAGGAEHEPSEFMDEIDLTRRFWNPRQLPTPIEPHAQLTTWDAAGHLHVWAATQRPHGFRDQLADVYQLDPSTIHVTAPAVGGGFGGKVSRTPDEHVLPLLSSIVGRPVRWVQTRSEYFQGATQGRGEQMDFQLAGSADGRISAIRCDVLKDCGAYPGVGGGLPSRFNAIGASGPYDIAHVEFASTSVVTNAPQVSAFRGAGRAAYLAALERLIDIYAAEIDMDPAEVRRRNLVRPEQMPFTSATGAVYDEADYPGDLDRALAAVGYDKLRVEQGALRQAGSVTQVGIGIATYHLQTVGAGGSEEARDEITASGGAVVYTGTTSQGHGHDATWAQIAADELGMSIVDIVVLEGSTDHTATGVGAVGSRSLQTAGIAIKKASGTLVERAKFAAAALLEASAADIECTIADSGGAPQARFHVAGVPSVYVGWSDVAAHASALGQEDELVCGETHNLGENTTYPSGTHIAVVDVDTETGSVALRRFVGVDDVGVRVNPMIVEGQLHGGIASGISQVLGEEMRYDDDGNPLTTNFADYPIVAAAQMPFFELAASETPSSFNDLAAKGVGESGIIGATPALHNAIVDAVRHLGVEHIELPCTPQRVWQAITSQQSV